jgi:hypothetical protein
VYHWDKNSRTKEGIIMLEHIVVVATILTSLSIVQVILSHRLQARAGKKDGPPEGGPPEDGGRPAS